MAIAAPPDTARRLVARLPIVDIDDQIVAFQLLHRSTPGLETAPSGAGETMTMAALLGDLTVDVGRLVGDVQVFCQAGPGVLEGTPEVTAPGQRIVLEVPAELCADDDVIARCHLLLQEGYAIGVDHFTWLPGIESLLELADVVRIDLEACSREHVADLVARCLAHDVVLLASGCRTDDDIVWAAETGFALFQGHAVHRPVEVSGATLAPTAIAQVQLAAELLDERLDFRRVEAILTREPALVAGLLQHASSGADGGLRREVHSVREALVLLGTRRLRQWAAVTVLGRQVSNVRSDALAAALVRARMCELMAQPRGFDLAFAFTAGLLSSLDRLLGVEISEVESRVEVDDALAAAAFRRETPLGALVGLVADYQDAVDDGAPTDPALGDVELVAAMAFCWAMAHVNGVERSRPAQPTGRR